MAGPDDRERCYLVAVARKSSPRSRAFSAPDSILELGRLAVTAGCQVVGHCIQALEEPHPRTYVGSGKLAELAAAVEGASADTLVFDDELSPGQLRNLDRAFGGAVRLCDRTALILDIFSQRAATREGQLQVSRSTSGGDSLGALQIGRLGESGGVSAMLSGAICLGNCPPPPSHIFLILSQPLRARWRSPRPSTSCRA